MLETCADTGPRGRGTTPYSHHVPSLNQIAPEPSFSLRYNYPGSSHSPVERGASRKLRRSHSLQSMRSVRRNLKFHSGFHSDDVSEREYPSRDLSRSSTHSGHSAPPPPSFGMKPRTATPGRRAHSRGRSAPPERTRTQHGTQHHHAQSQKSVGSRQSRGRSASRRRKQHPWLRKLLWAVQFPLRALHAARTRRKTVRVHLQGGTDATARRVVEAVVESLMLNFAEFQPASQAHPAATEGDSMQCSDTVHKQRICLLYTSDAADE